MSETVVRTGWPCSPKMSQKVTGLPSKGWSTSLSRPRRSWIFGEAVPGWLTPARSPLTSAMKTGTPIRLKCSAMTCSVTVLPVPVAPATSPWRLAMRGSRKRSFSPLAMNRPSSAIGPSLARRRPTSSGSRGTGP